MTGHVPRLTDLQLSLTTADEEAAHFWGEHTPVPHVDMAARFPAGVYRVIDGQVYRIVSGTPAEWTERSRRVTRCTGKNLNVFARLR